MQGVVKERAAQNLSTLETPLFRCIPNKETLYQLATQCKIKHVDANTELLAAHSTSDEMYVIIAGQVRLTKQTEMASKPNRSHTRASFIMEQWTLAPGDYFGLAAMSCTAAPRATSVTSTKQSILLVITREVYAQYFSALPEMQAELSFVANPAQVGAYKLYILHIFYYIYITSSLRSLSETLRSYRLLLSYSLMLTLMCTCVQLLLEED
jgi:CRP-like cAMP-binding protein